MNDKEINESESLLIIQQMIRTAKKEQTDDGMGWIIWGWLLFATSILSYFNGMNNWVNPFFFWNVFGLLTIVLFLAGFIRSGFKKGPEKVKTYAMDILNRLNTGFFLSLVLIIFSMNTEMGVPPARGFCLLLGIYAFWALIHGSVLNFRPYVVAAFIMWALALAGLFLNDFQDVMLIHALGVLTGYIIPGHMANRAFRKLKREAGGV